MAAPKPRTNITYSTRHRGEVPPPALQSVSTRLPDDAGWEQIDHLHAGAAEAVEVPCSPEESFLRAILCMALRDARSGQEERERDAMEFFVDEPLVRGFIQAANLPETSYDAMLVYIGLLQES